MWETSTVRQLTMHIDYTFQPEPSLTIVTIHEFSHSHPGVNRSYPIYGDPAIAQKRKYWVKEQQLHHWNSDSSVVIREKLNVFSIGGGVSLGRLWQRGH